uniref:Uncharacterized protein n=1 Tax=Apteryx owenii TaxID=8824 RepID=A0A8B9QFZ8_APTOW
MASQEEKQAQPFADIFDEDEAEKSFLLSKPTCFIVLGKPGSGKKTLARKLAQIWKCTFIEGNCMLYSEHCFELLFRGQSISEELVTKMILKKIESPKVAHFGYILSGFPSLSEEYMTVSQQIEKIKNLKLKPDFLINIKCSDYDLCQRISGQRQCPDSGQIYQRNQWDPNVIEKHKKMKDQHKEDNEEEEEEQEEEIAEGPLAISRILPQLVQRPEDIRENAEERVGIYKEIMLHPLENMAYVDLEKNYTYCYYCFNKQDELFRVLSSCKLIANRYRWRRSRWGQACPVALKEGDIVMGIPDLAVSFLGKMYVLSSSEALKAFMLNPRPYLLPPMPLPPCKVLVFGPPLSGRTTICNLIANKYNGKKSILKAWCIIFFCLFFAAAAKESLLRMPEITSDHPEVQAMVEEAVVNASESEIVLSPEIYAEVLERAIAEVKLQNKDRFPGAPEKGGWVVDNYPLSVDHWSTLSEKGLLPDVVVCLQDTENNGICVLHRLYLANKDEINAKILKRLTDEALKEKEAAEEER